MTGPTSAGGFSSAGAPPRLLWPSTVEEANLELERVGASGPWTGPLGVPPRSGRARLEAADRVALKWPGPTALPLPYDECPEGIEIVDSGGAGYLLFGALGDLLRWLDEIGEEGAAARQAVRYGSGVEAVDRWEVRNGVLELGGATLLMGVVNITEDSFYAGSQVMGEQEVNEAIGRAADEGADLIDVGAESTRPGAEPVSEEVQIERIVPAIEQAVAGTGLTVSVDTTRAAVAREALAAGAAVINDVSGATDDLDMLGVAADRGAGLVLMHRQGTSTTMQEDPRYDDLCGEIIAFLAGRADAARRAGVEGSRIAIDPGLGFGKRRQHNFELYRRMAEFHALGYPLLVGPSRKRHTSGPSDRPAEERLMATAAACALLAAQGVQILRVHDVAEMRKALDTADEIRGAIVEDRAS